MFQLRKRIWQWRGVLIIAPSVAAGVIAATSAGLFQLLEWATLDQFFRLRPLEPIDPKITIVTINESDIRQLGHWPVADDILVKLIKNLNVHRPRAIGLDLYRDLPVPPGQKALAELFQATPNLVGIEKVVGGETVSPPPVLQKLNQVGFSDVVLDADGKVRRGLLSVKPRGQSTKLGLATKLALIYLQQEGITLQVIDPHQQKYQLGMATFTPFSSNDGGYVHANAGGYQVILNYRGPQKHFDTISIIDVLENKIPPDLIYDRVILIGSIAESTNDLFPTPYSSGLIGSPELTPGVIIHANLVSQIVNSALGGRPFLRVWSEPLEWVWIFVWSLIGAAGRWRLLDVKGGKTTGMPRWVVLSLWIVVIGSSLIMGSYLAFLGSWWIPVISPLMALTSSAVAMTGYYSRELQRKNEQELRESERKFLQFLEAVPVGVAVLDINGTTYYTNQQAQTLLGQGIAPTATAQELTEVYGIYVAGTQQLYPNENLPIVRALNGERTTVDDLEIHQHERIIPIESKGTPIYDESGKIAYAIATFQDITERRQAESERQRFTAELFQVNETLEAALDAEFELTDAYGRFVPHQFLSFLGYDSITDVKLGEAVQLEMSILFADIRNFTTLSEQMNPEDNFKFINGYLSRMEPAILENNGFIDKYIGDAIMALFGGSADDALRAAFAMLTQLAEYNTTRQRPDRPPITIGIGINTGSLMLGIVGGQNRMDGTVISDAVNLAARIEGLTKNYGVSLLISHHTFLKLEDPHRYAIRLIDQVKVKGKSDQITVYEAFEADPMELKEGKLKTQAKFEEALLLYHGQSFQKAAQLFQECLRIFPQDTVAQIYLERCRHQ